jgi:hypothetical protein
MKNIAVPLSASLMLFFAACSDNPPKDSGQDQVPQPVMNSGPETEEARANKAVDSAGAADRNDSPATSNDHH